MGLYGKEAIHSGGGLPIHLIPLPNPLLVARCRTMRKHLTAKRDDAHSGGIRAGESVEGDRLGLHPTLELT